MVPATCYPQAFQGILSLYAGSRTPHVRFHNIYSFGRRHSDIIEEYLQGHCIVKVPVCISGDVSVTGASVPVRTGPEDGPNSPFGAGYGIIPGRVIWAWNRDATNENCKNVIDNGDWYFNPVNANQGVISNMFSESVKKVTGKTSLKRSWEALFQYHNQKIWKSNKGYSPGEKIFIKINQGTASWVLSREERDNGYTVSSSLKQGQSRRLRSLGATETSPYIVLELRGGSNIPYLRAQL